MLVKIVVNEVTEDFSSITVLYDDSLNNSGGYLNLSTANPVKAVAAYETPTIQKIYWCDGYNNVRYANISSYLTTDSLVKGGGNYYFTVDLFEFLPEVTYTARPYLDMLSPGNVKSGIVQYAFQYFNNHGSETSMSPLSNTIHITTDSDYQTTSFYYKGEKDTNKTTGKSVSMVYTVPDSDKYDYIRIIRLHYETINAVPTITVIGEIPIHSTASTITFTDTGSTSLGTLTLDQFNLGETELFGAEDLAIKNNRLFAANISKEEFSIGDWDARAVRFKTASTARVTDTIQGTVDITTNFSNWSSYTSDHDGINPFNDPANDGDSASAWNKQSDLSTLGAEGPNIKIGFTTDAVVINNNASLQSFAVGTETTSDNKSYTSFASPYMSGRRSWQRDEVYRLYIVFFNAHGIASPAKWICDLRMPSFHDATYNILSNEASGVINTTALYPTVFLKSFPTGAVSAQLLRVERGGEDRSILTQALVIPMSSVSGAVRPQKAYTSTNNISRIIKLVSPEINITKNITKGSSDYIQYIADFATGRETDTVTSYVHYHRLNENTQVAFAADCKATIDDLMYVTPRSNTDTFSFNGVTCANYDSAESAYGCSGVFVHHTNAGWDGGESKIHPVVNYKRDVHASQYGGQTFEAREGNIAIPASDIMSTYNTTFTAWNGDTFINFFDVTTLITDLTKPRGDSLNENVYVPLESSINCDLRHDRSASKIVFDNYPYNVQEVAGKWTNASGETYFHSTSLYQYNTVYSQELTARYYINIPDEVSTDTEFDCMVRVSKTKLNGEAQDSWTVFPMNDFIEVSTKHGEINALKNVNDKLLFWQTNAFGVLSVNERSLIQDSGGAALVLGTGGVLDRYDYISDTVGVSDSLHIVPSQSGVYWLNTTDRSMYRFTQQLENISKSKLMQSWIESTLSPTNLPNIMIRGCYDKKYNEVLYSFYNTSLVSGETLVFNETINAYSGFYDFYTPIFIPYLYNYLTVSHVYDTDFLFYHNSRLKDRCCFHSYIPYGGDLETLSGSPKYKNSTIKVVFNDDYGYTKAFDNLAYVSHAYSNNVEIYNNTFSSIRCYNNYQNTDYCTLTYGTNLERDEREWTTFIPRNAVDKDYATNPDVFDAGNIDKSRTFKERIRDKYMITDFVYTNTASNRFVVPYISVKYRISYR